MMKKCLTLFFMLSLVFTAYNQTVQTVYKLTTYTADRFDGTQFAHLDSTVLKWQNYKPNIVKNLINKLGLGFPKLPLLKGYFPQPLKTDGTLPDSAQYLYKWDTTQDTFLLYSRTRVKKNNNHQIINDKQEEYDAGQNKWVERNTGTYFYDQKGRMVYIQGSVSIFTYYGDSCYYDEQGNIIRTVQLKRNNIEDTLDNSMLYEYQYNGDQVQKRQYSKWDLIHKVWEKRNQIFYSYDSKGDLSSTLIKKWNKDKLEWGNRDSTFWQFDSIHQLKKQVQYLWNDVVKQWKINRIIEYSYNANHHLTNKIKTIKNGNTITFKEEWEYDFQNNHCTSTTYSLLDTATNTVNPVSKWEYLYDSKGNCIEASSKKWKGGAWKYTTDDFDYHFYYTKGQYIPSTVSINEQELTAVNVFPNPSTNKIHVVAGDARIRAISLYSMNGKCVYDEIYNSSIHKASIPTFNLHNGIYILNIRTDGGIIEHKVVVQH